VRCRSPRQRGRALGSQALDHLSIGAGGSRASVVAPDPPAAAPRRALQDGASLLTDCKRLQNRCHLRNVLAASNANGGFLITTVRVDPQRSRRPGRARATASLAAALALVFSPMAASQADVPSEDSRVSRILE